MKKYLFPLLAAYLCFMGCTSRQTPQEDYTAPVISDGPSVVVYSQTQSTVNGKPFIPLGIYGVNPPDMPCAAELGFNLVQSYQFFGMSGEEQNKYLDTAKENGLMVFASLNGTQKLTEEHIAKIKATVMAHKDHPALYAWYLADEPSVKHTDSTEFKAIYDWIKETDRNHPVINSNWELWNFKDACDADMRQLYDGVASKLTVDFENYMKNSNKGEKTWVAIINSYDSGWNGPGVTVPTMNPTSAFRALADKGIKDGDPEWEEEEQRWQPLLDNLGNPEAAGMHTSVSFPDTPEKVRGAFYWAFAHGSNGVYYWLFSNPEGSLNLRWGWYTLFYQPQLCEAVKSTLAEIGELSEYLVNPHLDYTSFKDEANPGFFVWSKCVDSKRLVIVINETGKEYSGISVDLSPLGLSAENLKVFKEDGRILTLENGMLEDSFKEDEAHVYFVE